MNYFNHRVSLLQKALREQDIGGAFFFNHTEIAYFTGTHLGNLLFIPKEGDLILFTRKIIHTIKEYLPHTPIMEYHSLKDLLPILRPFFECNKMAFPFQSTPYLQVERLLSAFSLKIDFFVDAQILLNHITMIKTKEEILAIKEAGDDISQVFSSLTRKDVLLKTETSISSLLFERLREIGFIGEYRFRSPTPMPSPCVLTKDSIFSWGSAETTYSGKGLNPTLATGSSSNIIEAGIPFIIDIVHNKVGLNADITRTFIVGEASPRLQKREKDLKEIFTFIQSLCKIGTSYQYIYNETLKYVEKLGYKENFMGISPNQSPFIGHNIGAWIDESPSFNKKETSLLQEGMTFALEPKFYFLDFDSPGIESNFVQTKEGLVNLTAYPETITRL